MDGQEGWIIDAFVGWLRGMDGPTATFVLLAVLAACGMGVPIPEDIILISAGFLAAMGKFPLWFAILFGIFGVLSGDAVLFFLGRRYGEAVFEFRPIRRLLGRELIAEAKRRVVSNARFICFVARFLPGLRSPIYLTAGAMGVPPHVYLTQDIVAACLSVPVWVTFGWWFGEEIEYALLEARKYQTWVVVGVIAIVLAYVGWHVYRARTAPDDDGSPEVTP